jgi:hypothetical protein
MKKRRVLKMAAAPALVLSMGLVAACDETVEEPAVEEPAVREEPATPQQPAPTTPAPTTPGQSPTLQDEPDEPAEEPGGMGTEEEQEQQR